MITSIRIRIRATVRTAGALGALVVAGAQPGRAQVPEIQEALDVHTAARLALQTHPAVRRADAEVMSANAGLRSARATLWPTLSATGTTVRFQEPMVVAPLHAFDPTRPPEFDRTLIQGSLEARYTLFDGGQRSAARRGAGSTVAAVQAGRDATHSDVLARVVEAFTEVRAARARERAAEAQFSALQEEEQRAERMQQEGAAPRVEVLRAGAARAEAEAALRAATARRVAAERDLARMTGLPLQTVSERPVVPVEPRDAGITVGEDAGPDAVGSSPGLRRARQQLETARAEERAARSDRFPRINGVVAVNQFGSGAGDFVNEWQAGVQLSYPLFTGGGRGARIDRFRAMARGAEATVESVELELLHALDAASAALVEARERRSALTAAVDQYQEVARIEALALAEGAGLQRDLLAAQSQLFRARSTLAQAEAAFTRSAVEVARIRGDLTLEWIIQNLENSP